MPNPSKVKQHAPAKVSKRTPYEVETENLQLYHGTSQPAGSIVQLTTRSEPNGEPIPALFNSTALWSADSEVLSKSYAYETGLVDEKEVDATRYAPDAEPQIYHFDVPKVKVATIWTKYMGLEQAERTVKAALKENPDVLRLHRNSGTEYAILDSSKLKLVRITDGEGLELPPMGSVRLQQPSKAYCNAVRDELTERLAMADMLLQFDDLSYGITDYTSRGTAPKQREGRNKADYIGEANTSTEDLASWLELAVPHFQNRGGRYKWNQLDGVSRNEFLELQRIMGALQFSMKLSPSATWKEIDQHRQSLDDYQNTVNAAVFNQFIGDWGVDLSVTQNVDDDDDFDYHSDVLVLMDYAVDDLRYWKGRCETKRTIPDEEYCELQKRFASDLVEITGKKLLELEESGESPQLVEVAKKKHQTADARLKYWDRECNRLKNANTVAVKAANIKAKKGSSIQKAPVGIDGIKTGGRSKRKVVSGAKKGGVTGGVNIKMGE